MLRHDVVKEKPPWISREDNKVVLHPPPYTVATEPLTPKSFIDFGYVIEDPEYPHEPSRQTPYQTPISANQGTARKYAKVSPVFNHYKEAPSRKPPSLQMSYFACEPRNLDILYPHRHTFHADSKNLDATVPHGLFKVKIMERHPYTTQTFAPMGLADTITPAQSKGWPREHDLGTGYVVIVAPTIVTGAGEEIPDMSKLRAFLANGRQAVTYGADIWHSPMVVVGKEPVGFLVTQWANDVGNEDCEEIHIETQQLGENDFNAVIVRGFEGHHAREEA